MQNAVHLFYTEGQNMLASFRILLFLYLQQMTAAVQPFSRYIVESPTKNGVVPLLT